MSFIGGERGKGLLFYDHEWNVCVSAKFQPLYYSLQEVSFTDMDVTLLFDLGTTVHHSLPKVFSRSSS